jgi:glycosyltransferase involved in cell wall biosynthesis
MQVLMFSMERALLGEQAFGDAVSRHKKYAQVKVEHNKEIERLNIIVFSLRGYKFKQLSDKVFAYPTNSRFRLFYFFDALKIAQKIYQENPYQLTIGDLFTGLAAWLVKRKFKTKFLMHFHGDFWENREAMEGKWHNWFILLLSKFLARRADGIRVVSSGVKDKLVAKKINPDKIAVINTPTSINLIDNPDEANIEKIKQKFNHQKIILFIGRLEKVKNISMLLHAFKDLKVKYQEARLLIIGQGSEKEKLEQLTQKLKLESDVVFLGKLNVAEWRDYLYAAKLLVLPSLSESFGSVLALAGAAGLPVVASKTTGAQDIVKDNQTGFLVPINDPNQLKEKMLKLLQDEPLAIGLGTKAKEYCRQKFAPQKTIRMIVNFWWQVVGDQ